MTKPKQYTPNDIGSGQLGICTHCKLPPDINGYDGCLGELNGVMNACCGHGNIELAYVQLNHDDYKSNPNKFRLSGIDAIEYIKQERENENT